MKVICIHEPDCDHTTGKGISSPVKFGNIYTIYNQSWWRGLQYYELKEIRGVDIQAECFAPLSSIDETEMIREYNLTPEKLKAHSISWYTERLKTETRIEARSFLRSQLYFLRKKVEQ